MWNTLTDHLEVVYGAALALVIVSAACGLAVVVLLVTGRSQALRPLSVLGVAAVLGRVVQLIELTAVVEQSPSVVLAGLEAAVRAPGLVVRNDGNAEAALGCAWLALLAIAWQVPETFFRTSGLSTQSWPPLLAFLRYALLVERGQGGAPEDVVLLDRPLQALGVLWVVLVAIGLYVA